MCISLELIGTLRRRFANLSSMSLRAATKIRGIEELSRLPCLTQLALDVLLEAHWVPLSALCVSEASV